MPKMYLPILIDVVDVISTLKQTLPETDTVDMSIVVKAMLERIFYNVNPQFGHLQGPFGGLSVCLDGEGIAGFKRDLGATAQVQAQAR